MRINIKLLMKLALDTLDINNFGFDLMNCLVESGLNPTLCAFLKEKIQDEFTREELLNYEFPSCSVFYGMDKTEFNKLLDEIYD